MKEAFSAIWGTEDLITSLDTMIAWRPWWGEAGRDEWRPTGTGVHVDQNPFNKPGFHCVQVKICQIVKTF